MTWQQIADNVNRKLVQFASPPVLPAEMVGLLNEAYDALLTQWWQMTFERDEFAIQLLTPLKQGPISPTLTSANHISTFEIDTTVFPGGLRAIASFRGYFKQSCSGLSAWRMIEFLSDNDLSDLENPLRMPTNDFPRYRMWFNTTSSKKKVSIYYDGDAPTTTELFYYRQQTILTSITGSPEVDQTGHRLIVNKAVAIQSGTNEDQREEIFERETNKDLQVENAS